MCVILKQACLVHVDQLIKHNPDHFSWKTRQNSSCPVTKDNNLHRFPDGKTPSLLWSWQIQTLRDLFLEMFGQKLWILLFNWRKESWVNKGDKPLCFQQQGFFQRLFIDEVDAKQEREMWDSNRTMKPRVLEGIEHYASDINAPAVNNDAVTSTIPLEAFQT